VFAWWKEHFPNCPVEYINAGVGATNSKFGVARVGEDVLIHRPDVIFVEFSVNDSDNELYEETFEGLIRKILLDPKEPALFMFNNVFYDDGRNAQQIHNRVGTYYSLPMVSMKESIYEEIRKGTISNQDVSSDNLHPNDFGHELVAGVINHLLDKIYSRVVEQENIIEEYSIPMKPLTANRYMSATRYSNRNTQPIFKGFHKDEVVKQGVWDVFRYGWSANKAGSSIHFEVEGSMIMAQFRKYALHPAPIAKLIIDGDEKKAIILDANFDETWGDCLYLQDLIMDLVPGRHTVEVRVEKEVTDKDFYLASIITA
jgi:lysophospholipase L1-like esterase